MKTDISSEVVTKQAAPTIRFFARFLDVAIESLLIGLIFAPHLPENNIQKSLIAMILVLALDFAINAIVGNTLGKFLFGLYVRKGEARLNWSDWLTRTLGIWISGFAFGLPPFNLFTFGMQFYRLKKGKPASYDQKNKFIVLAKKISVVRLIFVSALAAAILFANLVFNIFFYNLTYWLTNTNL